ncbi:hypothetical protein [Chelonobacter oris]|uniref:hypothetical protein n=1 Tax=Chelonobacter oris TaxID=505317 RepID=UPI003CC69DE8
MSAVIVGAEGWADIKRFGDSHLAWLRQYQPYRRLRFGFVNSAGEIGVRLLYFTGAVCRHCLRPYCTVMRSESVCLFKFY